MWLMVNVARLLAACTFTNSASKQKANAPGGDLPAMVRVDGVLYQLDMEHIHQMPSLYLNLKHFEFP